MCTGAHEKRIMLKMESAVGSIHKETNVKMGWVGLKMERESI